MTREKLIDQARAAKKTGDMVTYRDLLQILERENVLANLSDHMERTLGTEKRDAIWNDLTPPDRDESPDKAPEFTGELMRRLSEEVGSEGQRKKALSGNAHGIPPEAFAGEKEFFDKADSLEAYLAGAHHRAVETLQKHADSGEIWFEQVITQEVVDFVKAHREVLGGVLRENRIYLTKIPYAPDEWLREKDEAAKRYLACHCPMAREALKGGSVEIDPLWCHCSAGFAKQKFEVLFGREVEAEVVESVFAGDDRCRFAIIVPDEYL